LFAFQGVLAFGAQVVGRLPRFVHQPLVFGLDRLLCLAQAFSVLLVEFLVPVGKRITLRFRLGHLRLGVREFSGDSGLPRVDGIEDGLVEESASATTPG
jgi:hypothetical protein